MHIFVCNFFEIWTLCSITKNHLALVLKKLIDYWLTIPNAICTVITIYQKLFFMKCWFISKPSVQLPSGSTISISIKGSSFHNSEMTKVFFFWDQSGHELKWFPAKTTSLWFYNHLLFGLPIRGMFFGGKPLEFVSWLWSQKKLTLVTIFIYLWYTARSHFLA